MGMDLLEDCKRIGCWNSSFLSRRPTLVVVEVEFIYKIYTTFKTMQSNIDIVRVELCTYIMALLVECR